MLSAFYAECRKKAHYAVCVVMLNVVVVSVAAFGRDKRSSLLAHL